MKILIYFTGRLLQYLIIQTSCKSISGHAIWRSLYMYKCLSNLTRRWIPNLKYLPSKFCSWQLSQWQTQLTIVVQSLHKESLFLLCSLGQMWTFSNKLSLSNDANILVVTIVLSGIFCCSCLPCSPHSQAFLLMLQYLCKVLLLHAFILVRTEHLILKCSFECVVPTLYNN